MFRREVASVLLFLTSTWTSPGFGVTTRELNRQHCENFLMGKSGTKLRHQVRLWAMNFGPKTMNVFKFRPESSGVFERDEHHVSGPPPSVQEIEKFISTALTENALREEFEYLITPIEFSKIDRLALGIEDEQVVNDRDLENLEVQGTEDGLHFKSENGLQKVDMTIPLNDIHIGFNNAVEHWKVQALHEVQDEDARKRFLEMEGHVLFLRKFGKFKIGYMTNLSSITNPELSPEGPKFNIFLARDCSQFAEYIDQVIFPKRGRESGRLNICLHELGTEIYVQNGSVVGP